MKKNIEKDENEALSSRRDVIEEIASLLQEKIDTIDQLLKICDEFQIDLKKIERNGVK